MWQQYLANNGTIKTLPLIAHARLLNRAVRPILTFKCPRWAFREEHAKRVDRMQIFLLTRCTAKKLRAHNHGEDRWTWVFREAWNAARVAGLWSTIWAKSMTTWHAHIYGTHAILYSS